MLLARRYRLVERIGAGGMSVIWRGWDEALHRTVAIKVLDGPLSTDGGHRDRIRREARAAARIEHPHAIQVYDYGETVTPGGRVAAFVVMQLLDGAPLADRLAEGALPWPEAAAIAATVADVLAAAHRRGVVHRDVTPENVMLTTDGVKLLDFGIAAEAGQREDTLTFGTPPYVAPERLAGAQSTGATDVYALGVLLYESLSGSVPFGATTWEELEANAGRVPSLDVPGVPAPVAEVCRRCLAPDPADRPTAEQVAAALCAATAPAPARSLRWLIPAAAVAALIVAVTTYLFLPDHREPRGTVGGATTSAGPSPVPSPAPPSPAPTAKPTPSPSAAPLTVDEAAQNVHDVLARRGATGEIRPDVAIDVRNQVNNLLANPGDAARRVDSLRKQLRERLRAQSISAAALAELDRAIVALGDALSRG
jgi:serine/threonine protein kinase